ncbi:MAG: efflux RND transporter periplasmic adaptor subunit [Desulfovibrionaceae bacterium]|nr:efflux RND transporter periplasmic adaptor subunit [Desulfovibrionaceae bacterium]
MKKLLIALAVLILCALAYFFLRPSNKSDISYLTEPVIIGDITKQVTATGEVSAVQLVSVGAQVSGQIKKLHAKLGQEVRKGELIAEIDSVPQENQLNIDKAKLDSLKAQLAAKKVSLRVAQTQYNRTLSLRQRDAVSREALEDAENALELTKAEVTQLESQIRQTQIAVDTDRVNLGYTQITAPLDGIIVSVPVDEGQTVNANQTTPTIVQIADLNTMEIKIEISEGDICNVAPGMPIEYTILSKPEETYHAVLTSIDPGLTTLTNGSYKTTSSGSSMSSSSSSSTSSASAVYFYGKAQIDNRNGPLRIGMTTQNVITVSQSKSVLLAPIMSIISTKRGKFVRVLDEKGVPQKRAIATGLNDGVHVEILSGLKEGEKVVTAQLTTKEMQDELTRRNRTPRR